MVLARPVVLGLVLLACASASGCAQPGRLLVIVESDLDVPGEIDCIGTTVARHGTRGEHVPFALETSRDLPLRFGVAPEGGSGLVDIDVGGGLGRCSEEAAPLVRTRARVRVVSGSTNVLRLRLDRSCVGMLCDDDLARTCVGGRCELVTEVASNTLPGLAAPSIDAGGGDSGAGDAGVGDAGVGDAGDSGAADASEDAGSCDETNCVSSAPCETAACVGTTCVRTTCESALVCCAGVCATSCDAPCAGRAAGEVCRPSAGPCDVAETCDGISPACPRDDLAPSGRMCRPSVGVCDAEDVCSGIAASCPDVLRPATTVCRDAAGPCDPEELCTGAGPDCPTDSLERDGMPCNLACGPETCRAGACVGGVTCGAMASLCVCDMRCDTMAMKCP